MTKSSSKLWEQSVDLWLQFHPAALTHSGLSGDVPGHPGSKFMVTLTSCYAWWYNAYETGKGNLFLEVVVSEPPNLGRAIFSPILEEIREWKT